jgi:hypothetical protein
MKAATIMTLLAVFLLAGNAMAVDLSGTWVTDNWCVPGDDPNNPTVPKYEESRVVITQQGQFFTTENIIPTPGEECGGVIKGKEVHMTCPPANTSAVTGTIFHGEIKGKNKIVGINHIPDDGATCTIEARRQ